MAKAAYWTVTDVEARKRGEQTGLDIGGNRENEIRYCWTSKCWEKYIV